TNWAVPKNKERTAMRSLVSFVEVPITSRNPEPNPAPSTDLQVLGRFLASVGDDFIMNRLAFVEGAQTSTLNRGNMDEHVLAAALRLNETIAFRWIEPLHRSCSHCRLSLGSPLKCTIAHCPAWTTRDNRYPSFGR